MNNGPEYVTLNTAYELLRIAIRSGVTPILWGGPGIGKSYIVHKLVNDMRRTTGLNVGLVDIRLSQIDPVDLGDFPVLKKGEIRNVPTFYYNKAMEYDAATIFLDELNCAVHQTSLAAAYRVVLEKYFGQYSLRRPEPEKNYPGDVIIAACNTEETSNFSVEISQPLNNRFTHIFVHPSVDEWEVVAINDGVHPAVIGYLKFNPAHLYVFPKNKDEKAFPTPRSWEMLSKQLYTCESMYGKLADDKHGYISHVACNTVGIAGYEFVEFVKRFVNLPTAREILDNGAEKYNRQLRNIQKDVQYVLLLTMCTVMYKNKHLYEMKKNGKKTNQNLEKWFEWVDNLGKFIKEYVDGDIATCVIKYYFFSDQYNIPISPDMKGWRAIASKIAPNTEMATFFSREGSLVEKLSQI